MGACEAADCCWQPTGHGNNRPWCFEQKQDSLAKDSASDAASEAASEAPAADADEATSEAPAAEVVKAIEEKPNTESPVLRGNQCRCSDEMAPVCGEDGHSYANACSAKCKKVEIAHKGKC